MTVDIFAPSTLGTIATQNANNVNITGGTIGGTNIANGVVATPGNVGVQVNGFAAQAANGTPNPNFGAWYQFSGTGGQKRWLWQMLSDAESGGNAGSTLRLDRYSDAGAYIQTVMEVVRSTGQVNCNGNWSFTGTGTWTGLNTFNGGVNATTINATRADFAGTSGAQSLVARFPAGSTGALIAKDAGGNDVFAVGGGGNANVTSLWQLIVSNAFTANSVSVDRPGTLLKNLSFRSGGVERWRFSNGLDSDGANLFLQRLDDTQTIINLLSFNRLNGSTTLAANIAGFAANLQNGGVSFSRNGLNITAGNSTGAGTNFLRFTTGDSSASCDFGFNTTTGATVSTRFNATIFRSSSYTLATLPTATGNASDFVYCSNLTGGPGYVFSDGTNWRRFDNTIAN